MADLPANTQYGGTSPAKTYPKLNINPGGSRRPTSAVSNQVYNAGQAGSSAAFKTGVPIAPAYPEKSTPVPADYSTFKPEAQYPYEINAGLINPQTPMIRQMPWEGGGQYVIDQNQPGALIKSNREFVTPSAKAAILGALPSRLFQVDHIIPLWAGGADTPQNLQVLANDIHDKKTAAQAVALTLLANKKITLNEAKVMAMTWDQKDTTNLPPVGENGLIDLKSAEEVAERWKKWGKDGAWYKPSNIWAAVPDATKQLGEGTILPRFFREFVKGSASGLTGGVIPYEADDETNTIDKGFGVLGNVVGSIIGIGKFAKFLMPVLAKTGWKAFATKGPTLATLATAPVAGAATVAAKEVPKTLVGKALSKVPYQSAVKYLQTKAVDNIIRNTAIFTTYGALTGGVKFGLSNKDQDDVQELTTRLSTDLGLGILTGGLANNWKGSAGVGVGTLILGQMLGEEPEDSLTNALTMAGLHKLGGIRPLKADPVKLQASIEKEANDVAQNLLHWWGGKGVPKAPGAPMGEMTSPSYTQNDVFEWTQKALQNLDNYALSGRNGTSLNLKNNVSLEEYQEYRNQLLASGRQLYKTTLPPAEREAADMADLISLSSSMKDKSYLKKGGMTLPESVPTFTQQAGKKVLLDNSVKPVSDLDPTLPTGEMQLRGLGTSPLNEDIGRAYAAAKAQGQTSPYVIMVTRPDAEPVFRRMNDTFTPEEVSGGFRKASQNPGKSVQAFAVVKDPVTGEPQIGPELGWWPRRFSIDEASNSFNNRPQVKAGEWGRMNPELNKDTMFDAAEKNGTPVFLAKVKQADIAQLSKKPYVLLEVTPETWALSKDINGGMISKGPADSIPGAISRVKSSVSASEVSKNVSAAAEKARSTQEDAATVLSRSPIADARDLKAPVTSYMQEVKTALEQSQTPEMLAANLRPLGITLDGNLAAEVFQKKGDIKARQILGLFKTSVDNKTSTPEMAGFFESTVRPFLKTASGRQALDKGWGEMPVAPARPLEDIPLQQTMTLPRTGTPAPEPALTPRVEAPVAPQAAPAAEAIPTVTGQGAPTSPLAVAISQRVQKGDIMVTPQAGIKAKPVPLPGQAPAGPAVEVPANIGTAPAMPAKSLLEQAPINQPVAATAKGSSAYEQALEQLEMAGMGTGREMDTRALDEQVDLMINVIRNSPVTDKEKQKLAKRALELINKEDLAARDVSMGKSSEAWEKQTRIGDDKFQVIDEGVGGPQSDNAIGTYIEKQRAKIEDEFDVIGGPKKARANPMTAAEQKVVEEKLITDDAASLLKGIPENKKAEAGTYERAHAEAFDAAMTKMFGKNYMQNKEVLSLLSDKSSVFGPKWKELLATSDWQGKDITQPKDVVAALARGKKASSAIRARNEANNKSTDELYKEGGETVEGMRVENPNQAASENFKDLTLFQSKYQQGLLDEIENGLDPKLSPIRGIQDAKRQSLLFADMYNDAIRKGLIPGKEVDKKITGVFKNLEITMRKMAEKAQAKKATLEDAKKELKELIDSNRNLRNVGGTRARELAKEETTKNLTRMEELRAITGDVSDADLEILVKTKTITPKQYDELGGSADDATVQKWYKELDELDGQGGPGIQPPETSLLTQPTPGLNPLVEQKRSPADYLLGRSVLKREPQPDFNNPADVTAIDSKGAASQLAATQAALTKMPAITPPKVSAPKEPSGLSAFLTNAKENLFPTPFLGGGGIAKQKEAEQGNPIIMGYDTTSYATDPAHAKKLNAIMTATSTLSNAAQVETYIREKFPKSPLTGSMVVAAAQKHGVPASLVLAIMQQDSSMGTAGLGAKTKNPGNVGNDDAGNIRRYATWSEGVEAVAAWLAKNRVSNYASK